MIAHVVLFQPKSSVSAVAKAQFLEEIRSVARNIPSIVRARVGRTISIGVTPENTSGHSTYQYAAIFEFAGPDDLTAYLLDPAHDRLRSIFWSLCEATLIADVELFEAASSEAADLV